MEGSLYSEPSAIQTCAATRPIRSRVHDRTLLRLAHLPANASNDDEKVSELYAVG